MKKRKIILLFSDLEGTILREEDGEFDDEKMHEFLRQLDKLQQLTDGEIHMHLVSPVYMSQMEKVMDRIDRVISRYNDLHHPSQKILPIECAVAYPEGNMYSQEFLGDRIMPFEKPVSFTSFDISQYGKEHYVRSWIDTYKESETKDLLMAIYCGNGRNDLTAMKLVNEQKAGFVICPKNSRREVKEKAFHASEKTDLSGITEGISLINREIEKRKNPELEEKKDEIPVK